jgi:metal-sulfur cluster biosynthetic enzyme
VVYTLTSMGCPVGPYIAEQIETVARGVEGVDDVSIELTWTPPWSPEKMSEDAKFVMGF